jgi:di/tricarboxylate transporter
MLWLQRVSNFVSAQWSKIGAALTILCSVPLLFVCFGSSKNVSNGAFLLVFMSLSWSLMPWSIYVTSLFPLVLLPLLRLKKKENSAFALLKILFVRFGGFIVYCLLFIIMFLFFIFFRTSLANASTAASLYFNDAICLFVGSFILTAAMERWQLHRRS